MKCGDRDSVRSLIHNYSSHHSEQHLHHHPSPVQTTHLFNVVLTEGKLTSGVEAVVDPFSARGHSCSLRGGKVTREMSTKKGRHQQPTKLSHHGGNNHVLKPKNDVQYLVCASRVACSTQHEPVSQRTRAVPCETRCDCGNDVVDERV